MIKNDFFTESTTTEVNTGNVVTDQIQNYNMATYSDAYWLGWIKPENIPSIYHLSKFSITDTAYVFTDVTKMDRNYNIGYLSTYNEYLRSNSAILYPTNPVTVTGPSDYARYINKLDVMSTGIHNTFQIDFRVAMYQGQSGIWRDMGFPINTMLEMFAYLNGDSTVTISFQNQNYYTVTKSFKLTDMTDGALEWDDGSTQYVVTILGFHFGTCQRSINSNGNFGQYISPTPCIDIETDEHTFILAPAIGPFTRSAFQTSFRWNNDTWQDTNYKYGDLGNYDLYASGLSGEIPKTFIEERMHYGIFGNMLVVNDYNNYTFRITRIYTIDDIKHFMGLQIRVISDNTADYDTPFYGYSEDNGVSTIGTWAPHVSEENEFLAELITGNLSDTEFRDELREWQYDVNEWSENKYEEGDLPPYTPGPTPIPTEDKFTGDNTVGDITRVLPNGGVQFFALNGSELANFRDVLWSQPKSFYSALQITGLYRSSIFDYITSLRLFPIAANLTKANSNKEKIYMGTGAIFKDNNGNDLEYYPGEQIKSFSCGTWNLNDTMFHWRNNYLDYAPYTKISIYLPYVGTCDLDPAAIAAFGPISQADLELVIFIDTLTGSATYYLYTVSNGNQLLLQKTFKMGVELPLSGNDSAQQSANMLRAQFNTSKAVLGGVLSPMSAFASGNVAGGVAGVASLGATIGNAYLENSLAKKQVPVEVQGVGGVYSNLIWGQVPYITVHRQKYSNPENYGHTTGFLVDGTYDINNISGFTVCRNVDVGSIGQAVDKEKAEIKKILESGFYA